MITLTTLQSLIESKERGFMNTADFLNNFGEHWALAFGVAASMFALTAIATSLNPDRRDDVALWLMGAQSEEDWSRSFIRLFDCAFGENHLTISCFLRSTLASLVSICAMWLVLSDTEIFVTRVQGALDPFSFIMTAILVNVVTDYFSLLETRWLLQRMPQGILFQLLILILDILVSALIVSGIFHFFLNSYFHSGEEVSIAQILGFFSILSILFYSTFMSSAWAWAYILSSWVLKMASHFRLSFWLDVENKPVRILLMTLSLCVGSVSFLGTLFFSYFLDPRDNEISTFDYFLCGNFKGQVCLDIAKLTSSQKVQLELIIVACVSGITQECTKRANSVWETDPDSAQKLYAAACNGGSAKSCTSLGLNVHLNSVSNLEDMLEPIQLFEIGCAGGDARGCTHLGIVYGAGIPYSLGLVSSYDEQGEKEIQFFTKGCHGGDFVGCEYIGQAYWVGWNVKADRLVAMTYYRKACDSGSIKGCTMLGHAYEDGLGVDPDPTEAFHRYQTGCQKGFAYGCTQVGRMYESGPDIEYSKKQARVYYGLGCEGGHRRGCLLLEELN